jgi:hypothetical protein
MPGCADHLTRDTKRVLPVGSCNLSACACPGSLRLIYLLASNHRNCGVPLCKQRNSELPWVTRLTFLGGSRDLMQRNVPAGQVRSSQVRLVTRPESTAMRATRQLMLPRK